jgi:hypothetical protein
MISIMLIVLCSLAALDLWRQYAIKSHNSWFDMYVKAATHNENFWKFGYRIEDLELKLELQHNRSLAIKKQIDHLPYMLSLENTLRYKNALNNVPYIRHSRIVMHELGHNDSAIYIIRCGSERGNVIRSGFNDFRTDPRDVCQLTTSTSSGSMAVGPHSMFEMIYNDEGSFALRSIANGRFVKAVGPPHLWSEYSTIWKLVIGGNVVGASELFRLTPNGYLYSHLMGGTFYCSVGQAVTGRKDSFRWGGSKFVLEQVTGDDLEGAYMLVDLSNKVLAKQEKYNEKMRMNPKDTKQKAHEILGKDSSNPVRICLGVPMTSKGTDMKEIVDSPFWTNLFDSFMKSIDWQSNRYIFRFYLGFDKADEMYDTGDAWSDFREEFRHRAIYRMTEQMLDEEAINKVLEHHLTLKLMHFDHLNGAPTQVVSQLITTAYGDNFDYFYQVNDDTQIISPNWAPKLVEILATNPLVANFGVTGPLDSHNEKIFTHAFVHRTHIEIFGHMFPTYFKNWWSDDWISTVYGSEHTFVSHDVTINHNVGAQKTGGQTRYEVDNTAQLVLDEELRKGHAQVDDWLKKNDLPRLPLPNICGYIPLVRLLVRTLYSPGLLSSPTGSNATGLRHTR